MGAFVGTRASRFLSLWSPCVTSVYSVGWGGKNVALKAKAAHITSECAAGAALTTVTMFWLNWCFE